MKIIAREALDKIKVASFTPKPRKTTTKQPIVIEGLEKLFEDKSIDYSIPSFIPTSFTYERMDEWEEIRSRDSIGSYPSMNRSGSMSPYSSKEYGYGKIIENIEPLDFQISEEITQNLKDAKIRYHTTDHIREISHGSSTFDPIRSYMKEIPKEQSH